MEFEEVMVAVLLDPAIEGLGMVGVKGGAIWYETTSRSTLVFWADNACIVQNMYIDTLSSP